MSRKCGDCTLCCTLTTVPELGKPTNFQCMHCAKGCSIYERRPQSCRDFQCAWLRGEMPQWMRPDKVHVMIERKSDHFVLAVPERGHEKTWRVDKVNDMLIKTYQKNGTAVVSLPDGRALIPDGHSAEEVSAALRYFGQRQLERHGCSHLHN